ncbi:MAG: tRNA (adenosine(37)-N6)-threonylcarbamoyltransferase complex dimerization subunit type 1 TsaB [Planctomycetota bacterium]|jgi:tRNA threonylcarbamoyladenosine biosynthesis protein TsaB|nr:tRNA (adenosine(37)-N6)-threonylcarbamoyltransferase complex dimerization subunit type 1 TsaB [Planctomycetota bacterium]
MPQPRPAQPNDVVLALEASCRASSIALASRGQTAFKALDPACSHASDLLPALAELLSAAQLNPADITRIIVGTGPGSYTGLRVASSLAQGLARGSDANLVGIPSGEGLAFGHLQAGAECVHLLDARAGQLTYARYRRLPADIRVITDPKVVEPAELTSSMFTGTALFADESTLAAADHAALDSATSISAAPPRADHLLALDCSRRSCGQSLASSSIAPLYLRPYAARIRRR